MLCFPQLLTGASSQYPITKRITYRTVRNRCLDGREIKLADPAATTVDWTLTFEELIDDEAAALRDFFARVEGRLTAFTFLDPTDNLLAWSEKFDEAVWQRDALLALHGGVGDPAGGSAAFRLASPAGAPLRMRQTLNVPGGYYFALSMWLRSSAGCPAGLVMGDEVMSVAAGSTWRRLSFAASPGGNADHVAFGIELAPGATVEVFGIQVEAQIGASGYKRTASAGGVYPVTRFAGDGLAVTGIGPNRNGGVVRLRS